jgi:outer membrane protein OmpA-like peptidoglycan-associated protein
MIRKIMLIIIALAIIPVAGAFYNTWMGPTGGFGVYSADTLPAKEFAISFYFANLDREWMIPGDTEAVSLDYTYFLLPVAYGLTNKLELSVSPNYMDIRRNRGWDGSDGFGDLFVNLKANLMHRDTFGIGALLQAKIGTADMDEGLGTEEHDYGLSFLMTKYWDETRLHVNLGYRIVGEPEGADFDDQVIYGVGLETDVADQWKFIAELQGETSYHDLEPNDPMDLTAGFRYHNPNGFVFGGGIRYAFGMEDTNCPVGGFIQLGFSSYQPPPKATPVPTPPPVPDVTCSAEDMVIDVGEFTRVRVDVMDPLGGELTYDWTTSGCRIEPDGNEAVFYADECGPGTYAVNVTVTNAGGYSNQCGVLITVEEVEPEMQIVKLDLPLVPFQKGTRVDNVAKAILDDIAVKIQEYPGVTVELVGHTDSTGSEATNLKVGQTRAENVMKYLVDRHNIEPERFEVTSMGEAEPIADNNTAAGRIKNRRVEVIMMVEMPVE